MSVTIYKDRDFKGTSDTLGPGSYPHIGKTTRVGNDAISSMKVAPGYQCVAYIDDNYRGGSRIFKGDVAYVGSDFNDKITSLIVEKTTPNETYPATIFKDRDYGGNVQSLKEGSYASMSNLSVGNDQVSSLKVYSGYCVIAYIDASYQGAFRVFHGDASYVGNDFNDKISSLKVVKAGNAEKVLATAYVDSNYSGGYQQFFIGDYPDLKKFGMNDKISSIKVEPGYRVTAYIDTGYGGAFKYFEGDVPYVGEQFNDEISSLKVAKATQDTLVRATVYRGVNFTNNELLLFEGNVPNLGAYGMNDCIRSLKVTPGYRLIAFVDSNYRGAFMVFEGNVSKIGNVMHDVFSSIKVEKAGPSNQVIATLYYKENYSGIFRQLFAGNYPNLKDIDFNDLTHSMEVSANYRVIAYEHTDFGGVFKVYEGRVADVSFSKKTPIPGLLPLGIIIPENKSKISSVKVQPANASNTVRATMYLGKGFNGDYRQFFEGDYPDLARFYCDYQVGSLEVAPGYRAIGYAKENFGGGFRVFEKTVDDVGYGFDKKMKSLKVQPASDSNSVKATVFENKDYGGSYQHLFAENYPSMNGLLVGNDKVSSAKVAPGYRLIAYEHVNYGGRYRILEDDVFYVGKEFNDMTSSMKVEKAGKLNEVAAVLFEDVAFSGKSQQLLVGEYPGVSGNMLVGNDTVSSIRVTKGYRVEAFEDANYKGRCVVYTSDVSNMGDFNDKLSSVKVISTGSRVVERRKR